LVQVVRDESGKLVPLDVKQGDRVLFGKWSGSEVKIDGEELSIMKESDIFGIIEGKSGGARRGLIAAPDALILRSVQGLNLSTRPRFAMSDWWTGRLLFKNYL